MSDDENRMLSLATDLLLFGAASWGMKENQGLPYASSAFCLYGLRGFIGVVNFFAEGEEPVKNLYEILQFSTDVLCFPLFAGQIHSTILDPKSLALTHLIVPTMRILGAELDQNLLVFSDFYDFGSLVYYDLMKKVLYYGYLAIIPVLQRYSHPEKNYGKELVSLISCLIARTILRGDFPIRVYL